MSNVMIRDTEVSITDVLGLIATGYSYKQVLEAHPKLSLGDIMLSAKVALDLIGKITMIEKDLKIEGAMKFTVKSGQFKSVDELKKDHPRAFEKWTEQEHHDVVRMFKAGDRISVIAEKLQRSYGSIKIRLERSGLVDRDGKPLAQTAPTTQS